jgi:hypothetical protein
VAFWRCLLLLRLVAPLVLLEGVSHGTSEWMSYRWVGVSLSVVGSVVLLLGLMALTWVYSARQAAGSDSA